MNYNKREIQMQNKTIEKILEAYKSGLLRSDDSTYDWARANRLKVRDVNKCIANHVPELKACYGCTHIESRLYGADFSSPCMYCSRRIKVVDKYEKDDTRYRRES
jgi:hypothetical protein